MKWKETLSTIYNNLKLLYIVEDFYHVPTAIQKN